MTGCDLGGTSMGQAQGRQPRCIQIASSFFSCLYDHSEIVLICPNVPVVALAHRCLRASFPLSTCACRTRLLECPPSTSGGSRMAAALTGRVKGGAHVPETQPQPGPGEAASRLHGTPVGQGLLGDQSCPDLPLWGREWCLNHHPVFVFDSFI